MEAGFFIYNPVHYSLYVFFNQLQSSIIVNLGPVTQFGTKKEGTVSDGLRATYMKFYRTEYITFIWLIGKYVIYFNLG